jgi:hypothetical protein
LAKNILIEEPHIYLVWRVWIRSRPCCNIVRLHFLWIEKLWGLELVLLQPRAIVPKRAFISGLKRVLHQRSPATFNMDMPKIMNEDVRWDDTVAELWARIEEKSSTFPKSRMGFVAKWSTFSGWV